MIIWSFWSGRTSLCAEACQKTWHIHKENFSINILTRDSVANYLPDFPKIPNNVPIQLVSDLIRLSLLERYGGIWMDYSTFITRPISWTIECLNNSHAEMLAFYNEFKDEYRSSPSHPIIENGFIAARPNSKFIESWRKQFQECILSENYKNFFKNNENYEKLTENFLTSDPTMLEYLCCYISAQSVMLENKDFRIYLINAEDEYYYTYYKTCPPRKQWRFAEELLLKTDKNRPLPSIIKITGGHRRVLEEYIEYKCYRKDSLLGSLL